MNELLKGLKDSNVIDWYLIEDDKVLVTPKGTPKLITINLKVKKHDDTK